ncbi:GNAT family N-acetyltransferase [Actinophytocola oryzae]|nr:GNAT family N-acetyltransferase [Actinophytocola oryzae]
MDGVTNLIAADPHADRAARAAGVSVRELVTIEDFVAVSRLFHGIWRPAADSPLVTTELLRALTKAGNYLAGAYDGDTLVGACVGFFGAPADGTMHSHIAGVDPSMAGRNVGFALKLHQRAWALRRGVGVIAWTFDPLVARNAYFNLAKLGATAAEYLPDFYGGMEDEVNGGDETDRLLVRWDLGAPEVVAACAGRPHLVTHHQAVVALGRTAAGAPEPGVLDGSPLLVGVPPDAATLRGADPSVRKEWRIAVRDVLGGLLADGARVSGFDRAGWYVLTREDR